MRLIPWRTIPRRTSLFLVPFAIVALVVGIPTAAADTGVQNVNLSCDDGTNVGLTLSPAAVTELTNATTAMTLFPAGLTCGVSPQLDPPAGGNGKDSAVGGGDQFFTQPQLQAPCKTNFGFSSHTPSELPTNAMGSFHETIPGGCAGFGFTAELRVTITCLDVNANHADMQGTVTKATGAFANDGFTEGNPAYISADDNSGTPFPDELGVSATATPPHLPPSVCVGTSDEADITNGNISVNDADM
jgi:hypothetical protein